MTSHIVQLFTDAARRYTSARRAAAREETWKEEGWKSVDAPDAFDTPFDMIRLVAEGHLDSVEVVSVLGCVGYALRATLAGDEVGLPNVSFVIQRGRVTSTVLEMNYDSTNSIRSEPDPAVAFDLAALYVREGTPLRNTNRVAASGTRLVDGIKACNVTFYVRHSQ